MKMESDYIVEWYDPEGEALSEEDLSKLTDHLNGVIPFNTKLTLASTPALYHLKIVSIDFGDGTRKTKADQRP